MTKSKAEHEQTKGKNSERFKSKKTNTDEESDNLSKQTKSFEEALKTMDKQHQTMQEQIEKQELFIDRMNNRLQSLYKRMGYNKT